MIGEIDVARPMVGRRPALKRLSLRPRHLSEDDLLAAYGCVCHSEIEVRHTLTEWDEIEARQRAFAETAELVDAEGLEIAALLRFMLK